MIRRANRQQATCLGFTLVEVIVSLLVMSTILLWFIPTIAVFHYANRSSSAQTTTSTLSLMLAEQLYNLTFAELGSDAAATCLDPEGKAIKGTADGVCKEDLLNNTGHSQAEAEGETKYKYQRYSIVCSDSLDLAGGYAGTPCDLPSANLTTGPVPSELSCAAADYSADQKEIKVVVAYYDSHGKCHASHLQTMKLDL